MNTLDTLKALLISLALLNIPSSCSKAEASENPAPKIQKPKFKLTPDLKRNAKVSRQSFKNCKNQAFKDLKNKSTNKKSFKEALQTCQDRFAAGALFVQCKKDAIKSNPKQVKKAVKQCKRLLQAASFSPDDLTPYLIHEEKLFFAGIGFSNPQKGSNLNLPNFNCENIDKHMKQPRSSENYLFGNSPNSFEGFKVKKWKNKISKFKGSQTLGPDNYIDDVGFFQRKSGDTLNLLYFPISQCTAEGELGDTIQGLSAYYLIDPHSKTTTPFMAATFYSPKENTSKSLVAQRLKTILGHGYNISKPVSGYQYISQHPVKDFDAHGDPINICKSLNKGDFIGILKFSIEDPQRAEYTLVANVRALCQFGDKVFDRL